MEFYAATNVSVEVPANCTCRLEAVLEWYAESACFADTDQTHRLPF